MNVLFICNGNVARSQEAALYFNNLGKNPDVVATSAGIHPIIGKPIDPMVIKALAEDGLSMEGCYRKPLTIDMFRAADLIISFVDIKELPYFVQEHNNVSFWDVSDPRHQDIEFHRHVRDEIKQRVINLLRETEK